MFLPTTSEELQKLGWSQLDVILITGDSYIDSPFIGAAVIGHMLVEAGYRVGIIAQPDPESESDITRLGEPRLFWGVTGGSVDSMVANYTASKKRRKSDDYTPGGENNKRPDRAVLVYTNLIRRHFKNTVPIVLGGIEASLRRITHYDYWTDKLRAPILFDSKADYVIYGMGEKPILEFAEAVRDGADPKLIRGLGYLSHEKPDDYLEVPSYEAVVADKLMFIQMFHTFYQNNDPISAVGLAQRKGDRYYVQNPPAQRMTQPELDAVYAMPYQRAQHPYYEKMGSVRALDTIRFSISTHRGCYGECNFCAIAVHEGRTVTWRSQPAILAEAASFIQNPEFKGIISDVGGPTANMYGFECELKTSRGACKNRRCLYPAICSKMRPNHEAQTELLRKLREIPGVRKVFVASGIRYDLIQADLRNGRTYLIEVVDHHISGQMKIAPEHTEERVLSRMGKPGTEALIKFKRTFDELNRISGKNQFLTYYLIAAYPGCTDEDMRRMKIFISKELHITPEQVQIFTPTPSTYSSLMYYTEMDPFTGEKLFVEKDLKRKEHQKHLITPPLAGKG